MKIFQACAWFKGHARYNVCAREYTVRRQIVSRAIRILRVRVGGARKGKGGGGKIRMVYLYRFLCVSGMQLQVHNTRLSHDQFILQKVIFQLVEEVMATGSAGNIQCCLCEAVVDAKERSSVATTINLLKDTVVDVAVFNRDSKLCRRCHRKLVATVESRSRWEDERAEETDRESWRACRRVTVTASRSSVFLQAIYTSLPSKKASWRRITSLSFY